MEFITIHGNFEGVIERTSNYVKEGYFILKDLATSKEIVKNGSYYSVRLARQID